MCTFNITKAIKRSFVNEIRDFIFENYYKRIGFSKESTYYSMKRLKRNNLLFANKLIEKVPDRGNAKEYYELCLKKKNRKRVKQSEIINYQPKTFDTVDIQSVITENPKNSHKSSKTIKQAE